MGGGICELLRGKSWVGCRKITSGYGPGEGKEIKWCCMLVWASMEVRVLHFNRVFLLSFRFLSRHVVSS